MNLMSTLLKKVVLSTLAFLVIFLSFAPSLMAVQAATPASAGTWYNQDFKTWYTKVADPTNPSDIFGERYTAAQVQWVIYGLFAFIINQSTGPDMSEIIHCVLGNTIDVSICAPKIAKLVASVNQSSLANTNTKDESLLSLVFADRPLSGISYVREKINNFSIVPNANAQSVSLGFGFDSLKPVQKMWKATRDISYGLFVLTTIIFAFMIMFRVKISPQVVISVQSALPKIFGALILTTFSFAIAGFLIDIMYVLIGLISVMGANFTPWNGETTKIFNLLTTGTPGGIIPLGIIVSLGMYMALFALGFLIMLMISLGGIWTGTVFVTTIAVAYFLPVTLFIGLFIFIIVLLILIWHVIKVVWGLTKAFVNVLLLTIFAPLQFTLGVLIPNFGFGAWLKSYAAALSTFVVTGVLMFLSFVFLANGVDLGLQDAIGDGFFGMVSNAFFGTVATGIAQGFVGPNGTSFSWPPLLGSGNSGSGVGLLYLGVSFVLFTLIPKATEIVQGFISGKPFAYGSAIGEAFAPVGLAGKAGLSVGGVVASRKKMAAYSADNIPEGNRWMGIENRLTDIQDFLKRFSGH